MKVLHFAEYASGGVSTYLKDLISAQLKRRDVERVYLVVSQYKSDPDLLTMKSPKLVVIPYRYKRSVVGIFKILSMFKKIKKIDPDIIQLHSSFAGILRIRLMFSTLKKKTIYCAHGWAFNQKISKIKINLYKIIEKLLSIGCARIINISDFERKSAMFLSPNKMVTILNSIPDIEDGLKIKSTVENRSKIRLLFVGRLDKQKGVDLLTDAVENINQCARFDLTIIGDTVVNPVVDKVDTENVHFLGWQGKARVQEELELADVLVVPSRWEGFGLVSLEGMRAGKMVLASDAGALPEIVVDGKSGILFSSGSVLSIENALNRLDKLGNKKIIQMGEFGRKVFKTNFSYESMVHKIMNLYKDIAKQK